MDGVEQAAVRKRPQTECFTVEHCQLVDGFSDFVGVPFIQLEYNLAGLPWKRSGRATKARNTVGYCEASSIADLSRATVLARLMQ
jgi:hypothetical protein